MVKVFFKFEQTVEMLLREAATITKIKMKSKMSGGNKKPATFGI